jgi:hypothetical protein
MFKSGFNFFFGKFKISALATCRSYLSWASAINFKQNSIFAQNIEDVQKPYLRRA